MLTRTMLRLWQDDLDRLRKAHRHGDGRSPGGTAVHLLGTDPPVPRAAAATPLNCLAHGGAMRGPTELQMNSKPGVSGLVDEVGGADDPFEVVAQVGLGEIGHVG